MPLRVLACLCVAAALGCSADNVYSPLAFFPGSERTSWADCNKFITPGNEVLVCAGLTNQLGTGIPVYSISFYLPRTLDVYIAVYDSHGAMVRLLLNAEEAATIGQFRTPPIEWDLKDSSGNRVPGGDYRVYMKAGDQFLSSSDLAL
ncbi:MAG TPA: hypothetical protein VK527_02550 [Candidatus Limnocylindrales bacterium]|nr:hypothetical protein [Candidatus Limnocylindrales bacterium]